MKILFVTGFRKNAENADEIVTCEIISALQKMSGVEVQVTGKVLNGGRASVDWRKNPLFMARKILHWPVIDPNAADECYRQITKELTRTYYDALIVAHMPYDAVLAAVRAKKRFPDVPLMIYELDPIIYEIDKQRNSLGKYLYFLRVLAEMRTYDICDTIFHMECHRKQFSQAKYKKYSKKSVYLDFPLIHDKDLHEQPPKEYDGQSIRLIYAGKLISYYRSPEYFLKVLVQLRGRLNVEALFFSDGDCEDLLSEYAMKYSFIHKKGYVDRAALDAAIRVSDGLINIGNGISDMLPSKLLAYIETGMPILHIQKQENDVCIDYLNRYKLAVVINEKDPVEQSVMRLEEFLRQNYGRRLGSSFIASEFWANIPQHSAAMIVECIQSVINGSGRG